MALTRTGWCIDGVHDRCGRATPDEKGWRCRCDCHADGPWRIVLPMTRPLNLNDRRHWAAKAREVKQVKEDTFALVKQARIPACQRVRVTMVYEPPDKRRRDADNLVATLKPVLDGLVLAKVIPDDTPEHVEWPRPLIDTPSKPSSLWVLIEKLA